MKILHVLTQDFGGAGNAAYRLHLGLKAIGIDSRMLTLSKRSGNPNVYYQRDEPVNGRYTDNSEDEHIPAKYHQLWNDWMKMLQDYPKRPGGLEIFTDTRCYLDYLNCPEFEDADVINFHWVAGVVDFNYLPNMWRGKPIVWTLHDQNAFTGGCHYTGSCEKYKTHCEACPQLGSNNTRDISYDNWETKRKAYDKLNINVVTPSKWLGESSRQSSLFGKMPHHVIPYGFPLDKFNDKGRDNLRRNLGIPLDQKVVLFGADHISNTRKGLSYLIEALKLIAPKHKDLAFAFFGKFPQNFSLPFEIPIYNFGSIKEEEKISAIYSFSDVFVLPSLEDNLPNTVVEAMASGTPVVGFDIGGVPDMIVHKKTGYLANEKDINSLAEGIEWVLYESNIKELSQNSIHRAQTEYPLELQPARYVELYKKLIAEYNNSVENKGNNTNSSVDDNKANTSAGMQFMDINFSVKSELPKISFVTPSFNQAKYLEETIDSVLSQGYPNLEYIVMDGGSTDGSVDIIKRYEKHLAYWQSKPDGGQYNALNDGFAKTSGEIMGWINSDDRVLPLAFQKIVSVFNDRKDVEWITGRPTMINENSGSMILLDLRFWSRKKFLNYDYKFIQQESTFWRRGLYERAGNHISTEYEYAGDLELWTRMFRYADIHSIDCLLGTFRKREDQKSNEFIDEYIKESDSIIKREIDLYNNKSVGQPLHDPPPLIYLDDINLLPLAKEEVQPDEVTKLKRALHNHDYNTAKSIARQILTINTDLPQIADVYAASEHQLGNSTNAKAMLWNNVIKYGNHRDSYINLLNIELSEKRLDNATYLIDKMKDRNITMQNFDELKNRISGYQTLILEFIKIVMLRQLKDKEEILRRFDNIRNVLNYFYKNKWNGADRKFECEEIVEIAGIIKKHHENMTINRAFDYLEDKFGIRFNFEVS